MCLAYQEHHADVQQEGNHRVEDEDGESHILDLHKLHLGHLHHSSDNPIHDRTNGRKIIQTDQRIHLELCPTQQLLNHHQPHRFKYDPSTLEQESNQHELDLADGGDHDANDDEADIAEGFERGLGDAHAPAGEQGDDGHGCFEHLDEGDGEVEVGEVAADEGEGEHETDGDDATEVDAACGSPTVSM
jgi:hypothetical protein